MYITKKTVQPVVLNEKLLNGRAPPALNPQVKRCPDSFYVSSHPEYNGGKIPVWYNEYGLLNSYKT